MGGFFKGHGSGWECRLAGELRGGPGSVGTYRGFPVTVSVWLAQLVKVTGRLTHACSPPVIL